MSEGEHLELEEEHKLYLIKSPIVGEKALEGHSKHHGSFERPDIESLGFRDARHHHDIPELQRHEDATNIELFFDLFFAANLTVFSEVHDVTDRSQLASYIGYFCILWMTWALVGMFDVRFVTDSIFERVARAGHLGVMIGFAVVAPNFDPSAQNEKTFKTMSIILMTSRLILALQYSTIIWHVRKYRQTKRPLGAIVVMSFVAAMIYLAIAFRFDHGDQNAYIGWYIVSGTELVASIALSVFSDILTFKGTHLTSRMSLLTLIIIGEGIIVICTNVTVIVKNPDSWTSATIGVVLSGIATIYFVYQIYFDWKKHLHLGTAKQLTWSFMHFVFHLSLTLFVEASSQFIIWWKIIETLGIFNNDLNALINQADNQTNITTAWLVNGFNNTINDVFLVYTPKYENTWNDVTDALQKLSTIPNSLWNTPNTTLDDANPDVQTFNDAYAEIVFTVENSLFASFNIDAIDEVPFTGDSTKWEEDIFNENWERFSLVFIYAFVAAGFVLIFMNTLYIIARRGRWRPFNFFRVVVTYLMGVGLTLLPLITLNATAASNFELTPWLLPTLCLVFFFVLVLNHVPHPPPFLFRRSAQSRRPSSLLGGSGTFPLEHQDTHAYDAGSYSDNTQSAPHPAPGSDNPAAAYGMTQQATTYAGGFGHQSYNPVPNPPMEGAGAGTGYETSYPYDPHQQPQQEYPGPFGNAH